MPTRRIARHSPRARPVRARVQRLDTDLQLCSRDAYRAARWTLHVAVRRPVPPERPESLIASPGVRPQPAFEDAHRPQSEGIRPLVGNTAAFSRVTRRCPIHAAVPLRRQALYLRPAMQLQRSHPRLRRAPAGRFCLAWNNRDERSWSAPPWHRAVRSIRARFDTGTSRYYWAIEACLRGPLSGISTGRTTYLREARSSALRTRRCSTSVPCDAWRDLSTPGHVPAGPGPHHCVYHSIVSRTERP